MANYVPHHVWGNFRLVMPQDGLNVDTNLRELRTECIRCRPNGGPLPTSPRLGSIRFCSSTHSNHRDTCALWAGEPGDIWQNFTLVPPENAEDNSPGELATRCNYCETILHFSPSNHINHNTGEACIFMNTVPQGDSDSEDGDDIQHDANEEDESDEGTQQQNLDPELLAGIQQLNVDNHQEPNASNQQQNVSNQDQDLVAQEQKVEPQLEGENSGQNVGNAELINVGDENHDQDDASLAGALKSNNLSNK